MMMLNVRIINSMGYTRYTTLTLMLKCVAVGLLLCLWRGVWCRVTRSVRMKILLIIFLMQLRASYPPFPRVLDPPTLLQSLVAMAITSACTTDSAQ